MNSLLILSVVLCAAIHVNSRDQRSFFSWGDDQPKEEAAESPIVVPGYKPILQVRRYNAIQVNPVNGGAPLYYESSSPISVDQFSANTNAQLSNDELRYFDLLNNYAVPAFSEEGLRDFDPTSILPLVNLISEDSIDRLSYAVESASATRVKEKSKFLALLSYLKELKLKPFKYVAHVGSELIQKKKKNVQNAIGYLVPSLTTPQTPTLYDSEPTPAPFLYNYGPGPAVAYPPMPLSSHQVNYFNHPAQFEHQQPNYQHLDSVVYYTTTPAPAAIVPPQPARRESIPLPPRFYPHGGFSEYPPNVFHLNGDEENSKFYHPAAAPIPPPSQSVELDGQRLPDLVASPSRTNYFANAESAVPLYRNPTNRQQYSESLLPRFGNPTQHAHGHPDLTSFLSGDMETSASEAVQKIRASAQPQQQLHHKLPSSTSVPRESNNEGAQVSEVVDIQAGAAASEVQPKPNRTALRATQRPVLVFHSPIDESTSNSSEQPLPSSSQTYSTEPSSPVA